MTTDTLIGSRLEKSPGGASSIRSRFHCGKRRESGPRRIDSIDGLGLGLPGVDLPLWSFGEGLRQTLGFCLQLAGAVPALDAIERRGELEVDDDDADADDDTEEENL